MFPVINLSGKFDVTIFISDRYIAILLLRWFGCEMPIPAHFEEFFWGDLTHKCSWILSRPTKGTSLAGNTRFGVYKTCRSVKKCDLGARWKKQKKERKKEVTYLSRPPTLRYPHQSCYVGWGPFLWSHSTVVL